MFRRATIQGVLLVVVLCLAPLVVFQNRLSLYQLQTIQDNAAVFRHVVITNDDTIIPFKKESQMHDEMSNLHANFPLRCGQSPSFVHPAILHLNDMLRTNRASEAKPSIRFSHGDHSGLFNLTDMIQLQVCLYDVLDQWNQLSRKLGITQWAAHGGTAIGAKCFGAANPWDDDVDITIGDCAALDALWANGANVTQRYPDLDPSRYELDHPRSRWEARLVAKDLILSKGSRCCNWYKLMTVNQVRLVDSKQIVGIDMECHSWTLSGREKMPKQESGWNEYMMGSEPMDEVIFGPTTVKLMPQPILDKYIEIRYGKRSPCSFPYENGQLPEPFLVGGNNNHSDVAVTDKNDLERYTGTIRRQFNMDHAMAKWYIPKSQREAWRKQAGNNKQNELTREIPNLDHVEIDNTIAKPGACDWGGNTTTLKAIGFNAERGKYWDLFADMVRTLEDLKEPHVILMNEMDIGMARSFNVHTARRLALELGMNYAWGLEFVELTRGTQEEQNATVGRRDALSLHGNAILTKCFIADPMILRDELPAGYFATKPVRGINANGYEVRLGGRMGLFARIYKQDPKSAAAVANAPQPYFVVGNVHKIGETKRHKDILWEYFGFGEPPNSTNLYEGLGTDPPNQLGVVMQGDFGPQLCALGGLTRKNGRQNKAFPIQCTPQVNMGVLVSDFFCSNMDVSRPLKVTASCYYPKNETVIRLSDHGIVSVAFQGNDVHK